MVHRVESQAQQAIVAEAESTMVVFDYDSGKPHPVPDTMCAAIEVVEECACSCKGSRVSNTVEKVYYVRCGQRRETFYGLLGFGAVTLACASPCPSGRKRTGTLSRSSVVSGVHGLLSP